MPSIPTSIVSAGMPPSPGKSSAIGGLKIQGNPRVGSKRRMARKTLSSNSSLPSFATGASQCQRSRAYSKAAKAKKAAASSGASMATSVVSPPQSGNNNTITVTASPSIPSQIKVANSDALNLDAMTTMSTDEYPTIQQHLQQEYDCDESGGENDRYCASPKLQSRKGFSPRSVVNMEAADDDFDGVELVVQDMDISYERLSKEKQMHQEFQQESQLQFYKDQWDEPGSLSNIQNKHQEQNQQIFHQYGGDDSVMGMVLPLPQGGAISGDVSVFGDSTIGYGGNNNASKAASGTSMSTDFISQSARQAVSRLLDKTSMEKHLPPEIRHKEDKLMSNKNNNNINPPSYTNSNNGRPRSETGSNVSAQQACTALSHSTWKDKTELLKHELKPPKKELADLITAIAQNVDCTRRKNACGALKVLASKSEGNRKTLAWTMGVLPAITSVLMERPPAPTTENAARRIANVEARSRAVGTLRYLCSAPDNRVLILNCPGLVAGMTNVIQVDRSESRQGVCACIQMLTKTVENRAPLVKIDGVMEALMSIICVRADKKAEQEERLRELKRQQQEQDQLHPHNRQRRDNINKIMRKRDGSDEDSWTSDEEEEDEDQKLRRRSMAGESSQSTTSTTNDRYDSGKNAFLHGARIHVFATCLQLVKDKEVVFNLVRNTTFMNTILEVANRFDSPAHSRCIAVIAHLSRLGDNTQRMVFHVKNLLRTLVRATNSDDADCRKYACYALENLSYERACRQEIANVPNLIPAMCFCCVNKGHKEEQLAASSTLRNLADEPANLIPMTNSMDCIATLMRIAHPSVGVKTTTIDGGDVGGENSKDGENGSGLTEKQQLMQYYACDAIATISFWVTTIATKNGYEVRGEDVHTPKLCVSAWEMWE